MNVLQADVGIWPILIFWGVFAMIANAAKKKRVGALRAPPSGASEPAARGGFMDELRRSLEELKRVEQQQGGAAGLPAEGSRDEAQAKLAKVWLEQQKQRAAQKAGAQKAGAPARRVSVQRAVVPLEDDDADQSSEDEGTSLEGTDYDEQAERIIAARHQAAERTERSQESVEGLSTLQRARRESRQAVAIGGKAEHQAWHAEVGETAGRQDGKTDARGGRLQRFADGSVRGAIVLSEILGRPVGERPLDG